MNKKLSKEAYGGVSGSKYVPYVKSNEGIKELSKATLIIGLILAMVFSASNAYAGMISGLTVAAGIPGAILGAGLMRVVSKKSSVLNTTLIQGMASGGESVASGMIFVLPAVILIGQEITFFEGFITGLAGVLLGISATNLVHKYLIIEEHGTLIYPEAMAISETIVSSDAGGDSLKFMGIGAAIATVFTIISNTVLGIANTTVGFAGEKFKWQWSTDVNPLLLGIGFIVGLEVSLAMFAGSFLANFVVIPLIGYFAQMADASQVVWNNPDLHIVDMSASDIQGSFTKYIGAGMMLTGGIIGAIKLIPTIYSSIKATLSNAGSNGENSSKFMSIVMLIAVVGVLIAAFVATPSIGKAIVGLVLAFIFIVMFAIVGSKMTGDIGTSNLPVSGMTIASLLIVTVIFLILGWKTDLDNKAILLIGTIIVSGISVSGGYAQSHKVSFIMGGSKSEMERGFVFAAVVGVITVTSVILILSSQIGESIQPPQAGLMATLTQGVLVGNLPWAIIFVGVFLAIVLYLLNLPIMTVAIGFYLPMGTVTIILFGALLRVLVTKMYKDKEECEKRENNGIILSAGLVAGGSIIGLIGSALAIFTTDTGNIADAAFYVGSSANGFTSSNAIALILLIALCVLVMLPITGKLKK